MGRLQVTTVGVVAGVLILVCLMSLQPQTRGPPLPTVTRKASWQDNRRFRPPALDRAAAAQATLVSNPAPAPPVASKPHKDGADDDDESRAKLETTAATPVPGPESPVTIPTAPVSSPTPSPTQAGHPTMAPTTSAPTLEPPQTASDASAAQLDNRDPLPLPLDHDHALDWAQSPAAQRMAFNFSMEDLQTCPSTSFDVSRSDPGGTSSLLPVGEAQRACTDACMADNVGIIYMLHFRKAGGTTMHRFLLQHLMRLNLARHNPDTLQRITDLQVSQAAKAFHSNRLKMDDSTALGYFRNEMFVFPPCLLQQPRPAPLLAFTFLRNPLRRHFSHYTMDITAAQLVLFGLVLGCVKEHRQSLGVTLYNDIDRDFGGDFIPQCHIQAIFRKAQENPKASLPLITVNLPSTTMEDSVFSASAMKQHMSRLRTFDDWVGPFFEEDPAAFRDRFYPALIHRLDIAIAAESTPGRDGSETFLQWAEYIPNMFVFRLAVWTMEMDDGAAKAGSSAGRYDPWLSCGADNTAIAKALRARLVEGGPIVTRRHLEMAKKVLAAFDYVFLLDFGGLDGFGQGLDFQYRAGMRRGKGVNPDQRIFYNQPIGRSEVSLSESKERVRRSLGDPTRYGLTFNASYSGLSPSYVSRLEKANHLDMELFEFAKALVAQRINNPRVQNWVSPEGRPCLVPANVSSDNASGQPLAPKDPFDRQLPDWCELRPDTAMTRKPDADGQPACRPGEQPIDPYNKNPRSCNPYRVPLQAKCRFDWPAGKSAFNFALQFARFPQTTGDIPPTSELPS